jgi:hypothetical protein
MIYGKRRVWSNSVPVAVKDAVVLDPQHCFFKLVQEFLVGVFLRWHGFLKGQCHEIFDPRFFSWTKPYAKRLYAVNQGSGGDCLMKKLRVENLVTLSL